MKTMRLALILALPTILMSCGEPAASGKSVSLPAVYVNCTTSQCRVNAVPNPFVRVIITTSGCTAPDFGSIRSASTYSISCTAASGCYGLISGWVDAAGSSASTIPSGTYSICGRIDYNRDYPASTNGDSVGTLDNVAIATTTANQFVTIWSDL